MAAQKLGKNMAQFERSSKQEARKNTFSNGVQAVWYIASATEAMDHTVYVVV